MVMNLAGFYFKPSQFLVSSQGSLSWFHGVVLKNQLQDKPTQDSKQIPSGYVTSYHPVVSRYTFNLLKTKIGGDRRVKGQMAYLDVPGT